jgi:hypothetical protein
MAERSNNDLLQALFWVRTGPLPKGSHWSNQALMVNDWLRLRKGTAAPPSPGASVFRSAQALSSTEAASQFHKRIATSNNFVYQHIFF